MGKSSGLWSLTTTTTSLEETLPACLQANLRLRFDILFEGLDSILYSLLYSLLFSSLLLLLEILITFSFFCTAGPPMYYRQCASAYGQSYVCVWGVDGRVRVHSHRLAQSFLQKTQGPPQTHHKKTHPRQRCLVSNKARRKKRRSSSSSSSSSSRVTQALVTLAPRRSVPGMKRSDPCMKGSVPSSRGGVPG